VKISNPIAVKGENLAVDFLQKKGYQILARNYRKQYGEIDIVATHQKVLVFIEVKTRTSTEFGSGFEAISIWKIQSLMKTGYLFKKLHPRLPEALRIDAISVQLDKNENIVSIEHMENVSE
jgi:putative endonuclease